MKGLLLQLPSARSTVKALVKAAAKGAVNPVNAVVKGALKPVKAAVKPVKAPGGEGSAGEEGPTTIGVDRGMLISQRVAGSGMGVGVDGPGEGRRASRVVARVACCRCCLCPFWRAGC